MPEERNNISKNLTIARIGLDMDHSVNQIDTGKLTYALNASLESFLGDAVNYQNEMGNELCFEFPEGYVVVVHANCRWEHVEIIAPASAITPMLPAPVDLTDDEKTVLIATRSLKSSYNGIPNYRFVEAKRARGITLERWEAAKTSLIDKKFLNKAGAITVEGKNVCPNDYL